MSKKLEVEHNRPSGREDVRTRLVMGMPIEERRLQVAGVHTSVLEGGDGPPVLLLHGGIACGGVYWAHVMSWLAETHRVIAPDAPGFGESEPVSHLDAATFARWFTAFLRSTCNEKPILVAHSMLGSLAARYAAEHGHQLRRLIIYGAPGIGRYRFPAGLLVTAIRFDVRPSQRNQERFERWALLDPGHTQRRDPEWFGAFEAYVLSRSRVRHVKRTMRQLVTLGKKQVSNADLRRISIPTALVWGKHDRMVPLALAEAASQKFNWKLHVVDNSGHVPHLEQPEAFRDVLRSELDV